jgi:putative lipoic acid-binding regulatory protein
MGAVGRYRIRSTRQNRHNMTSKEKPHSNGLDKPVSDPRKESLIEYPSSFPIKVMGAKVDGFVQAVTELARQFDPTFDASTIELRDSRAGNYLGVTITITATSREQLDDLYRALSSHPMVKVVL